ncbi:MAG TPA: hypothetical protein VJH33_03115 [Candidatus Paceibacterota bacterium]
MAPKDTQQDFETLIQERFSKLPPVVQNAITSGNPEKQLRELSKKHQLHLDQWQQLENQVMLTLLGVYESGELEQHIERDVGVSPEVANTLAVDVTSFIFEPIREELERQLEHPRAHDIEQTAVETLRTKTLQQQSTPSVVPATPPPPKPTTITPRAPISETYRARELSSERKDTEGDPYREPAL